MLSKLIISCLFCFCVRTSVGACIRTCSFAHKCDDTKQFVLSDREFCRRLIEQFKRVRIFKQSSNLNAGQFQIDSTLRK